MDDHPAKHQSCLTRKFLWAGWMAGLLAWSYLLVAPVYRLPPGLRGAGAPQAKLGHAAAYAALTAYALWLLAGPRGWWVWIAVLSLHACGTELVQTLVPTRTGSWRDVAIDHAGLAIGLALARLAGRGGAAGRGQL